MNTKAKPVPLLASLVFLQYRNLPSPIQKLAELCMISSIFHDLYVESLKYSTMIQLPSNIYIPCSSAESLPLLVQPWESKINPPKYLRRTSFMIILKSELDLKIQAYPAWPSLFPCSPFHHEHKMSHTVALFFPTNSSFSSELLFLLHTCAPVIIAIPQCFSYLNIIWFHSLWEKCTFFHFTAQPPVVAIQEIPPAHHTLFTTRIRSTPFITLQRKTWCYFAFLKAINPLNLSYLGALEMEKQLSSLLNLLQTLAF